MNTLLEKMRAKEERQKRLFDPSLAKSKEERIGCLRFNHSRNKKNQHGKEGKSLKEEIAAAAAEILVLDFFIAAGLCVDLARGPEGEPVNVKPGRDGLKPTDICGDVEVEVKWADSKSKGLLLRGGDREDVPYVLVTGAGASMKIRGWLFGRDVKVPDNLHDGGNPNRPPCWIARKFNNIAELLP